MNILRDNHYHYQPSKTSFVCTSEGWMGGELVLLILRGRMVEEGNEPIIS